MTDDELKKLRGHYHALLGQQRLFDDPRVVERHTVESGPLKLLAAEIASVEASFPGIIPPFQEETFFSHRGSRGETYYLVSAVRSYLAIVVGKLKASIDIPESTPVTQKREFAFVKDPELRRIMERDYLEIQQDYLVKSWKSL